MQMTNRKALESMKIITKVQKPFVATENPNSLQTAVAQCLDAPLMQLNENYLPEDRLIVFTENQVNAHQNLKKHGFKESSLHRLLLDNTLFKLKRLLSNDSKMIDIAGDGYGAFFYGDNTKLYHVLNIVKVEHATYVENAEGDCKTVPQGAYDIAICLNYLLLANSPGRVVQNVSRFLRTGGIAILDFISLTYWVVSKDGYHWNAFTPRSIKDLVDPHFSEWVLVPVGNWFQGACNYYAKQYSHQGWCRKLLVQIGKRMGGFDHTPTAAIQYLVVAKK